MIERKTEKKKKKERKRKKKRFDWVSGWHCSLLQYPIEAKINQARSSAGSLDPFPT